MEVPNGVSKLSLDSAIDVHNPSAVAAYADVTVVAKVTDRLDVAMKYGMPWTRWAIECAKALKGLPEGCAKLVDVVQQGGVVGGKLTMFEGDNVVNSGGYYILACRKEESGRLVVIPVGGTVAVSSADFDSIKVGREPSNSVREIVQLYR
ncbi:hypothetical protein [Tsukamurella paurometabola]|uniref:Uncharacterized protein n=1 Tax=Tsukamurella paurometabola TaxID=2061 RepID=A0ABS5NIT5_TSUPA|nr:hypothetical protein [Tsukamurella paurometabola]MBS4104201.1 hypothetical protein [Tsukamurella paurometabola]UEA84277.1 hypothetical protein LK411_05470 [Tsukamurella paurometabola]